MRFRVLSFPVIAPLQSVLGLACLLLVTSAGANAQGGAAASAESRFATANAHYEAGDFAGAAGHYQALVDEGLYSADLFFNLGNSYYRQGNPGSAALWFHRALALDPRMAEARQNLTVIENQTGALSIEVEGLETWIVRLGPALFSSVTAICLWLTVLAIVVAVCVRRSRPWLPGLTVAALLFGAIAGVSIYAKSIWRQRLDSVNYAVITSADSSALVNAIPDADPVIALPPGSVVRILEKRGTWRFVAIPGDLRGWIHADHGDAVWPLPSANQAPRPQADGQVATGEKEPAGP